ncbi:Aspartate/glutamate/uridylate kinase [Hyaloraphidium curvatum]|nr:Aspartate/glutamate/uridylate kinase [Hyaloraphidium curvatum]
MASVPGLRDPGASCIVQKFGGTSLGTGILVRRAAGIVRTALNTSRPIVVVSALTPPSGESTTSRLLEACAMLDERKYKSILRTLEAEHLLAGWLAAGGVGPIGSFQARETAEGAARRRKVLKEIADDFEGLRRFLYACGTIGETTPRSMDVVVSFGERLAARIFAAALESEGTAAACVSLDSLVERRDANDPVGQSFYDYAVRKLKCILDPSLGSSDSWTVPVISGFFGHVPGGVVGSIGRGYADLTAALCAAATGSPEVHLYKDVRGFFTGDPSLVDSALLLSSVTSAEAAELAYYGTETLHPVAAEQASRAGITVRIRSPADPDCPGTAILPSAPQTALALLATAVNLKHPCMTISLSPPQRRHEPVFMARIFTLLARHNIAADLVSTSQANVTLALAPRPVPDLKRLVADLSRLATVSVCDNAAVITLVGESLRSGGADVLLRAIGGAGINIEMISAGGGRTSVSCVVPGADGPRALRVAHDACVLGLGRDADRANDAVEELNLLHPTPLPVVSGLLLRATGRKEATIKESSWQASVDRDVDVCSATA